MPPRRRKDRHEASGFSRRPDPDSDEDEDYERERRKRSKRSVWFWWGKRRKMWGGGKSQSCFYFMDSVFLCPQQSSVISKPLE